MKYTSIPWPIFATSKFWQSTKDVNPDYIASEETVLNTTALLITLLTVYSTGCPIIIVLSKNT